MENSIKTSVVITNYNPELDLLMPCFQSYSKVADEVIIISSKMSALSVKINQGLSMTKGDYVVITNDDAVYLSDSLDYLCIPNTVTSPLINGADKGFSGHVFCIPRDIYNITGGYDEMYEHAYYDDDDFLMTLASHNIPTETVEEANVSHPPHGGTTIGKLGKEYRERNRRRFNEKWRIQK